MDRAASQHVVPWKRKVGSCRLGFLAPPPIGCRGVYSESLSHLFRPRTVVNLSSSCNFGGLMVGHDTISHGRHLFTRGSLNRRRPSDAPMTPNGGVAAASLAAQEVEVVVMVVKPTREARNYATRLEQACIVPVLSEANDANSVCAYYRPGPRAGRNIRGDLGSHYMSNGS